MRSSRFEDPAGPRWGHENERGVAAVEFALSLPILLVLVVGLVTVGHSLTARYMLNSAAYDAARTCSLARQPNDTCANTVVTEKLRSGAGWCTTLTVQTAVEASSMPSVNTFDVRVDCAYSGVFGDAVTVIDKIGNVQARASMPY